MAEISGLSKYLDSTKTEFIGIDKNNTKRVLIKSRNGIHSILRAKLNDCCYPTIQTAIDKNLFFKNQAIEKKGDVYDYSNVKYINGSTPVEIICKTHGSFWQSPANHLSGNGCPVCNPFDKPISQDDFISRVKLVNPKINILSEISGNRCRVLVEDDIGIQYSVLANTLLNGCIPSIETAIDKNKAFEIKARLKHGSKYDYSKINYVDNLSLLTISCPVHGEFTQVARIHLRNHGCPLCANKIVSDYNRESPTGWSLSHWIKKSKVSKNFDSYKVYIIKCSSDDESFIKIGRTYTSLNYRFKSEESLPYKFETIKLIKGDAFHIFKLESKLKRLCKNNSYIPKRSFKGMYECFDKDALIILKDRINDNS